MSKAISHGAPASFLASSEAIQDHFELALSIQAFRLINGVEIEFYFEASVPSQLVVVIVRVFYHECLLMACTRLMLNSLGGF